MPLIATIAPARSAFAVATSGSPATGRPSAPSSDTEGPHTGHAFGWAWNRRSPGSSYSAWHRGHIVKPAIVVSGRSYGTPRTIVNRGPQFVQLMNG